jgi:hypothetical protein
MNKMKIGRDRDATSAAAFSEQAFSLAGMLQNFLE